MTMKNHYIVSQSTLDHSFVMNSNNTPALDVTVPENQDVTMHEELATNLAVME